MSESTELIDISNKLTIQLGDIIEIIAPTDPALNNHTFFIKFLDKSKIVLVEESGIEQTLTLNEFGKLDNEAITEMNILSRAESASYALQHALVPGKWIDIYFGGDVPTILTGEITNLEEDMIELTTFPEKEVIYIDFAYKGIPEDIPIIKINLRSRPAGAFVNEPVGAEVESTGAEVESVGAEVESVGAEVESTGSPSAAVVAPQYKSIPITSLDVIYEEEPETMLEDMLPTRAPKASVEAQLREFLISADQIQFGNELEEVSQIVEMPEFAQRYSLEKQTADLLDEMLSTIPNIKRTDTVLNNIHMMIERFKQLRKKFSIFDQNGNLINPKKHGAYYKPILETLQTFNQKLYWILPVVKNIKKIYTSADEDFSQLNRDDILLLTLDETGKEEEAIVNQYREGSFPEQENKYDYLLKKLNPYLTPFENNEADTTDLARIKVNTNISAIIDNLGDFYSAVISNNKETININRRRFVIQEYNLGISGLNITKFRGGDTVITRRPITENDTMVLKSLLLLPEITVRFSRINLPYTNIMTKANLNEHFLNYWQLLGKTTTVNTTVIENLDVPAIEGDTTSEINADFLKKPHEFKLDDSLPTTNDMYEKFLNAVFPKTRVLFNMIKPYITDNLTVHDVISYMEPFMIYQDDISFMQYQEINEYITQKIAAHKKNYLLKVREYNTLKNGVNMLRPKLLALFDTSNALKDTVLAAYGLTDIELLNMSSEEFIEKINSVDCGRVYNNAVAQLGANLMIANGMNEITEINKHIKNDEAAINSSQSHCKLYKTIAKRYIALDELQADDGEEIYFDKQYDPTYYDVILDYTKPDPAMSNEAYIGFLVTNLMKKNGLSESAAMREARAMLAGKRLVEDGDYAILEHFVMKPRQAGTTSTKNTQARSELVRPKQGDGTPEAYSSGLTPEAYSSGLTPEAYSSGLTPEAYSSGASPLPFTAASPIPFNFGSPEAYRGPSPDAYSGGGGGTPEAYNVGESPSAQSDYSAETDDIPGITIEYFQRQNNMWVKDERISEDAFEDKQKMICNLDAKCLDVKGKCDAMENGLAQLNDANLKLVLKEFDDQLNVNKAVVLKKINDELVNSLKRINVLLNLINAKTYKYNYKHYNLGNSLEEVDEIRSPYINLRDVILGQADYVKRQEDIIKFARFFSREPLATEDAYWCYCTKTNTKLLPAFLLTLAQAFISQEDFLFTVEKICAQQGKISDDGDAWVDKYSGYIIKKIALNVEEEYTEEGYKNITRAVLEADVGGSVLQLNKTQRVFDDPETEKIANIISVLVNFMGINIDAYKDFIIRNARKLLATSMVGETDYNKMLEMAAAKGRKNLDDYRTAYNQFLIFSTLSYLYVAIQVSIPAIRTRKTHPGCVRSFEGFPMGGAEDMTGITYMACIVNKIKSPIDHWKSIQKLTATTIAKKIETHISKFLLPIEEVQELLKVKQAYLKQHVEELIPDQHNIANMHHFLPPLFTIKLPTIENVSAAFTKELFDTLRKGSMKQTTMLDTMRAKIILFSFGIIESIQKAVNKKTAIMTNNAGEPFLENACCETTGKTNTLDYFITAQPDIKVYNANIGELANILYDIIRMGKAGIYYDPRDTKNIIPPLPSEFSEETIYKAFIVFCKYGNNMPISDDLKAICMNKPEAFNDNNSLAENIRKLKNEGRNYSQQTLEQLLVIVNRHNIIHGRRHAHVVNIVEAIKDVLISIEQRNLVNIPLAFREKFMRVLENFEINGLINDTVHMRDFQNYLEPTTKAMSVNINDFIRRSSVLDSSEQKQFKECLDDIIKFEETGDNMMMEARDETVFKMMNFIKNSMRSLTREFPNIIINKVNYSKTVIPKHWKLSKKHNADVREIMDKHYVALYEFYDDDDIKAVLEKYMLLTRDTELLAKLIEYYVPLKQEKKTAEAEDMYIYSTMERRLVMRLCKFYFYSILTDLISLKDDDEILIKKRTKRTEEEEEKSESDLTTTDNAFLDQTGDITELEIINGEKKDVADKIAKLLCGFMKIICKDKTVMNYNYKSMMDKVLRSKEKEKDDITSFLKNMTDEEREVETVFKNQQLERWSKGLQKGLVNYQKDTYDDERETMEKQMLVDMRLNKNRDVNDMNRDIYRFDMLAEEQTDAAIEDEEMRIDYMGEDADPEEFGMDGDEEFD